MKPSCHNLRGVSILSSRRLNEWFSRPRDEASRDNKEIMHTRLECLNKALAFEWSLARLTARRNMMRISSLGSKKCNLGIRRWEVDGNTDRNEGHDEWRVEALTKGSITVMPLPRIQAHLLVTVQPQLGIPGIPI